MNIQTAMPQQHTVSIVRTFNAPCETVFEAWTDPDALKSWFGPEGYSLDFAEVDLRVGGAYRLAMRPPEGDVFHHVGVFREINRPKRLVMTWILENQPCDGAANQDCETVISIDFRDLSGRTEVVLFHDLLPTKESRDGHEFGWSSSLDCLETFIG